MSIEPIASATMLATIVIQSLVFMGTSSLSDTL
jgi:hypothetical protein